MFSLINRRNVSSFFAAMAFISRLREVLTEIFADYFVVSPAETKLKNIFIEIHTLLREDFPPGESMVWFRINNCAVQVP